jgi:dephospho-CoA kinase
MKIIGIAGTGGAGKDVVADMLAEMLDGENSSGGDFYRVLSRYIYGLAPDASVPREQLYKVGSFMRSFDPGFTAKTAIFKAEQQGKKCLIQSGLRTMGEADAVRAAGGIIIGVDADPRIRYDRISQRGHGTPAQKTFEQFLQQDSHENEGLSSTGPTRGIRAIIDSADIKILNNGTLDELKTQLHENSKDLY